MFYYAFINESNTVTGVYALPSAITAAGYIAITEQQYNDSQAGNENSLIGKVYNAETNEFTDPIIWSCNASEVEYKDTETSVEAKLDAMDAAIAAAGGTVDAYTKAETDTMLNAKANTTDLHTHDNKTVLDGITAEKVAAWDNGTGGSGASVTADEVLTMVKTVDGTGSGLDADTLDGMEATAFAAAAHTHDYAASDHTHTGFAASDHTHDGYATADHAHTGYAATDHTHTGYAASEHTHTGYATTGHTHNDYITATTYANGMSGKADTGHTHSGYASSSHTHSGYASSSHTHSDYFPKSGGTVSGETNFSGGLVRVSGVQTLFHSGNQLVFGSNSLPTRIAGNAITATKTIQVDSDERLKEDIADIDVNKAVEFINGIDVKSFNYIGNDEKCIGAIAQQVQEAQPEIAEYFVKEDENGYLSVKVADLVFPLIACVQKLTKRIEELEKNAD